MMNFTCKMVYLSMAVTIISGCSSTTVINSDPSGARLYIDGAKVGTTPYTYSDSKIVGSTVSVKLQKDGYEEVRTTFSRSEEADVGAIIGGVFVLVPFLWTLEYKPERTFELTPISNQGTVNKITEKDNYTDQLSEIKNLLDQNIITKEEYDSKRKHILGLKGQ